MISIIYEYTYHLKKDYKIEIIWQVPRSPHTNVLGLGYWMSLQSRAERVHFDRRYSTEALVKSIKDAWSDSSSVCILNKDF